MSAALMVIVVWALHFGIAYGFTALACARHMTAAVPWVVGAASLVALVATAVLGVRAVRRAGFTDFLAAGLAGLAAIAIVWEASSLLGVPACADKAALDGNPEEGRLLLRQFGCGGCHRIPGVADAQGKAGPPLEGVAKRVYLAGIVPNSPASMARWIRNPKAHDPQTAMPVLGVGEEHARDMVAYLYRLR